MTCLWVYVISFHLSPQHPAMHSVSPVSYALSLPLNLTACPYFCSFVINASPCLTTSAYCLFLSSGRFVSMTPLTRSIVHGMRSAAMNLARSLQMPRTLVITLELALIQVEGLPIQKVNRHAKFIRHTLQPNDLVALQQLLISPKTHLSHKPTAMFVEVAVLA